MHEKIYELTNLIDKYLQQDSLLSEEKNTLIKEIKKYLSPKAIAIAQANPTPADIKGNAKKALKWIEWANILELEAIVFPELYLVGSPIGDFIEKFPIIIEENIEWLNALASNTKKTKVIIGFVEFNKTSVGKKYFNSVAVLQYGKIQKIVRKSVLSTHPESNDYKHFEPYQNTDNIIEIGDKKAAIVIGDGNYQNVDLIISCAATISRTHKEQEISSKLSSVAKQHNMPVIHVNQVGANDGYSYDGMSKVFDKTGTLLYKAKAFEEQFFIVNPFDTKGKIYDESSAQHSNEFSLNYEPDLKRTYKTIVQAIRDYFKKTGFKRAVLGLSGGLDSTVAVVLLVDALGKENVLGISMPSKITSSESKNDAKELAQNLGIKFLEVPIKEMYDATREKFNDTFATIEKQWDFRYKESFTNDNIQARSRAMILWGVANEFASCLPIATSDKSELYMGYATINGDMSGGFAPLADVTKTKLFALARWLNKNREQKNAIPESIIQKRPGAELAINPKTGKPLLAEEALMPYEFLDEIIWRVENLNQTIGDMIEIEFLYEKNLLLNGETISREQKIEWLEKFFRRMSTGLYKWTIMPPSPIVDAHSVNRAEYYQPIVSSKINFYKTTLEEKIAELSK